MAYDMTQLREVTMAAMPLRDKLSTGKMDFTQDEITKLTRAFDTWQTYLKSM